MGCCLGVSLLAGMPRLALFIWWITDPARVTGTFGAWPRGVLGVPTPTWAWTIAGFILLPWVTVAYVWLSPGGITGWEWAVMAVALLFDLGAHGGGGREYSRRRSSGD